MLEWMFTATTGALPSEDAPGKETAFAVAAKELSATAEEESDVVDTRD